LIAIPIAIIGSISTAASKGIIIKNPAILEILPTCCSMLLNKTGTLTQGKPTLSKIYSLSTYDNKELLTLIASLEEYSKYPLASAIKDAARQDKCNLKFVTSVTEKTGQGLSGIINSSEYKVVIRKFLSENTKLSPQESGLECILLENSIPIGCFIFQDQPRKESLRFVNHSRTHHKINNVKILSGDKLVEVQKLALQVGIDNYEAELSPEDKQKKSKKSLPKPYNIRW
jgi:P-type E1-E2 ATPase